LHSVQPAMVMGLRSTRSHFQVACA